MTLDPTHRAAGILFRDPEGSALFLKRGPGGDYPGYWCFPGGHVEGNETPEQAATREAVEEVGFLPKGAREPLARSISVQEIAAAPAIALSDGAAPEALRGTAAPKVVDHTTFLQDVPKAFEPERSGEHTGYAWSPLTSPPEPLHPGCRVAIDRLFADELGVARMMVAEALTSPQVYKNVTLWAMRITGTGVAYRRPIFKTGKDGKAVLDAEKKPIVLREEEFPWRDPALYLNDEFLARCNGLPVIWQHPKGSTLDSKEHARRVVGSIFLPYVRGDEVWGIAKVYDDEANAEMRGNQLSTSPAVVLSDPNNPSYKFRLEDGSLLLVEGKPSLLDHLAICERGVWDKGGEVAGIDNHDLEENSMAEEVKADAVAPSLADVMAALGGIALQVKDIGARVDAMEEDKTDSDEEKAKKDAEEKAEKEKADAEEKEKADAEEKAKKDAEGEPKEVVADAKKDGFDKEKMDAMCEKADAATAENKVLKTRLDALERKLPKDRADNDYNAMSSAQARADGVYQAFGEQAPRFMNGETLPDYRRRLVDKFKASSPAWSKVDLATLQDSAFEIAENAIYADAAVAAVTPSDVPDGGLRMVRSKTASGHNETKFYGRPIAWMSRFSGSRRYATAINPNTKREAV